MHNEGQHASGGQHACMALCSSLAWRGLELHLPPSIPPHLRSSFFSISDIEDGSIDYCELSLYKQGCPFC